MRPRPTGARRGSTPSAIRPHSNTRNDDQDAVSLGSEPSSPTPGRAALRSAGFPLLALLALMAPARSAGQTARGFELLPDRGLFAAPLADPLEPRMAASLISTNLLRAPGPERPPWPGVSAREWLAAVSIGGTIPVLRLFDRPEGGIVVSAQAGVLSRFRIELWSRDDLGQDWFVGMPIEAAWNRWSGRLRFFHRSAHIGDEFADSTGAQRIEFGGEAIEVLNALHFGAFRVYGGGGWVVHSNTRYTAVLLSENRGDQFTAQAGFDATWPVWPERGIGLVAGLDWQTAQRTGWRPATGAAVGIEYRRADRFVRLTARAFDGTSPMGEFFLTNERYGGLEFELGF